MFVVAGESLVDLVAIGPNADGTPLFEAHPGGSPYNCAIALARLGQPTGFICPISSDRFGDALLVPLLDAGVTPLLGERVAAPTSLAVATLDAAGAARYSFYRAADRAFNGAGLEAALPAAPRLFQIGGFCAVEPDDAEQWHRLAALAAARGATISIDPNVRLSLVGDATAYRQRLGRFFDLAQIVKLSDEDLTALDATLDVEQHARALLARPNCRLVVVTLGARGSRAFTRGAAATAGIYAPPRFGDTVGAGDSLMAGILCWLGDNRHLDAAALDKLDAAQLAAMLQFGAVVAGLNCAERGCHPPSRVAVERVLAAASPASERLEPAARPA